MDVVIVAYNSRGPLERSLPAALSLPEVERVVVVDNGSDGSGSRAIAFGAEVIALPSNPGFGAGQNAGVAVCSSPEILLLNPDAEPVSEAIEEGLAYLRTHPGVAVVQGVVVNRRTLLPERSQGIELGPLHLLGRALELRGLRRFSVIRAVASRVGVLRDHVDRVPIEPASVASLAATALLVRRSAFEEVRGFDERFFLYGEDLDLCRRLRCHGWSLVALPVRWALHTSGESSGSWFDREWVWWRGTLQFAARWWSTPAWAGAVLAACIQWVRFAAVRPRQARRSWVGLVRWALHQRRPGLGMRAEKG